jgi:hypothetical protein
MFCSFLLSFFLNPEANVSFPFRVPSHPFSFSHRTIALAFFNHSIDLSASRAFLHAPRNGDPMTASSYRRLPFSSFFLGYNSSGIIAV